MKTCEENPHAAKRGESSTFIGDVQAEIKDIISSAENRKLGKALVIEALKIVPYVGGAVSVTEKFIEGIAGIEREVRLKRLEAYLRGLGEACDDDADFREEDLLTVIKKLATDDESTKTEYYVRLTRKLGRMDLSEMQEDLRLHFIHTVSTLTRYQIDFARELKIRQTIPIRDTASFEESELALTGKDSGLVMKAVRTLQNAGLLKEKTYPPRAGKPEGVLYETTSDFTALMALLFHPGDFEPQTVGLERKEMSDIILVGTPCFIDNLYDTYLPNALKNAGLTVKIVDKDEKHLTTDWAPLYLQTGVLNADNKEWIKLYLTQDGIPAWKNKGDNYLNCKFDRKTYERDKSKSASETEYFRKEMDRVVTNVLAQLKILNPPA